MNGSPFTIVDDENLHHNPFADPSISNALSSSSIIEPSYPPKPTSTKQQSSQPPKPDPISEKEAELARREQELNAREAQIAQRQEEMRKQGFKAPNWPWFYPIVYHNIEEEIPQGEPQKTMQMAFKFWLATVVLLVYNMVACLAMMISHPANMNNVATDFGASFVYLFFITAGSFYLWYRPLYLAYQKESSLYFYIFMIFSGFHGLFSAYMAVGIPGSGSAGFINFLGTITSTGTIFAGILTLIAFIGWVLECIVGLYLWKLVYSHFNSHGHSFEKAKSQIVGLGISQGVSSVV